MAETAEAKSEISGSRIGPVTSRPFKRTRISSPGVSKRIERDRARRSTAPGSSIGSRIPASRAARPTARYIAPVSMYGTFNRAGLTPAPVDSPAPDGPSIATTTGGVIADGGGGRLGDGGTG